jgi:hypothetical protein
MDHVEILVPFVSMTVNVVREVFHTYILYHVASGKSIDKIQLLPGLDQWKTIFTNK